MIEKDGQRVFRETAKATADYVGVESTQFSRRFSDKSQFIVNEYLVTLVKPK